MSHKVTRIDLKCSSPGTSRFLTVHKFIGAAAGPKIYLQAALHADEWPGLLALQHLLPALIELDNRGQLLGEIILVPYANPIGMDQKINGVVLGRQSFSAEGNFNRHWPDLSAVVAQLLSSNEAATVSEIKQALREAVQQLPTQTPLKHLKATLLSLSIDADIVLDLHCDSQALLHLYSNFRHVKQAETLAKHLRIPVLLLEDEPGVTPFDAAHILPWLTVAEKINHSCFSATVELRGFADVNDEFAAQDARGLLSYLSSQGLIAGELYPVEPFAVSSTELTAVDAVMAPCTGIICWQVALGEAVVKGQLIAEIVDLTAANPVAGRTAVYSKTSGVLFAMGMAKLVTVGENVAKIAGTEKFDRKAGEQLLSL
ncbi:MAG: succinylglutamate desuccinylase/aspartoacylase family protein [Oceanospirillaceae bacterium]|nr:succinylglutamate desuccinylase/aspartoacylase family protein [Oceanospirillaceae bacterium]